MKVKNIIYLRTFKMALSATISIAIAKYIGLEFAVTAGIISILSIVNTKRKAIRVGGRRFLAAIIAILLSFVLYSVLGNNILIFGLFLVLFIPITSRFNIAEGLVPSAVLSTHLLTSSNMDSNLIFNEIIIAFIGIGVAMIFNLYSPSLEEKFEDNKEEIEKCYRILVSNMATSLMTNAVSIYDKKILIKAEELIEETRKIAREINENRLFKEDTYYISYMDMRVSQLETIKRMKKHFARFYMQYSQTKLLAKFTNEVANNIHENNDCVELIYKINKLRAEYKSMDLPKTRDEFENRALLFQFLNDLEDFLIVKKKYVKYRRKNKIQHDFRNK